MKRCFSLGGALLALALALPDTAAAQRAISVRDAVERVQRETGGRILSAETVQIGRQRIYRVKVLTPDGRVRVISVPAAGR
jgi:uncharacterized membrane protein YkoI